jgi:hypothetical protein
MVARDGDREIASRRVFVQLGELEGQAFAQRAGADACRIERLHQRQHLFDLRLGDWQVDAQVPGDLGRRLGEVAVVVQRVDDRLADPDLARIERADFELPDQVLVQVAAAFIGEFEWAVVVVGAGPVAGRRRGPGPGVFHLDDDVVRGGFVGFGGFAAIRGLGFGLARGRDLVERGEVDRVVLFLLEHDVGLERLHHLCLQFEHG